MLTPLPRFTGNVYKREVGPDGQLRDAYRIHAYQYAYTSVDAETTCQPAYIIYVEDDADIIKAISYARDNDLAVAVVVAREGTLRSQARFYREPHVRRRDQVYASRQRQAAFVP